MSPRRDVSESRPFIEARTGIGRPIVQSALAQRLVAHFAALPGRVLQLAAGCLLVLIGWLALAGTPAQAGLVHHYEGSFNGSDAPGGPFAIPLSDAADTSGGSSNGDVYVATLNGSFESVVYKFDAAGKYAGVQITGAATPQGSFALISFSTFATGGVAVDDSAASPNRGDVYVTDLAAGVVDKFSETGTFLCQITAKPPSSRSAGEVEHECDGASGSETPQGSVEPTGVTVDAQGDVYVSDAAHDVIDAFSSSGTYLAQISDPHITEPGDLTVDSAGGVLVANAKIGFGLGENVVEFESTGSFRRIVDTNQPLSVGAVPSDNHVYAGDTTPEARIAEYGPQREQLDTFGAGQVEHVVGIAVGAGGRIYAADSGHAAVEMFGPPEIVPNITINATEDMKTSATLTGAVELGGGSEVTECRFEYGATTSYGASVPCEPATPYAATTTVTAHLGGLTEGADYHFRLVACNVNGCAESEDHVFGPPVIDSQLAEARVISAITWAQINPMGVQTSCEVQYVDATTYASSGYAHAASAPCASEVGWEAGEHRTKAELSGLQPSTAYHYRFIATSGAGTDVGEDQTFTTFGIKSFAISTFSAEGDPFTQAAGHPYALTDSFTLNTSETEIVFKETGGPRETTTGADANPKDIITQLPPGLIGNPTATAKCSADELIHFACSGAAQLGVIRVKEASGLTREAPIYNLTPPQGLAAQFGAEVAGFATVHIDARVRTESDYGVTVEALNSSVQGAIVGVEVTLWGAPGDPSHNAERYCPTADSQEHSPCSEHGPLTPFLTNPTACSGERPAQMSVNSWQDPEIWVSAEATMPLTTGCGKLDFKPSMAIKPTSTVSDSPTGLQVNLQVPQIENPSGLAEADLKDASVTLPAGMTVNPASADGMVGCPLLKGREAHAAQVGIDLENSEPANCPASSKIGNVTIETPLLEKPLTGGVYIAQQGNGGAAQGSNPFGSLLALYIAAENAERGVVIKLAGKVVADLVTGQLTTTFDQNPQLPFSDLKLDFFEGPRAALATPRTCGSYQASSVLEPFSHTPAAGEAAGSPDAEPLIEPFAIDASPNGIACGASPFAPAFEAGVANPQSDAFSPFVMTLRRRDGEQRLSTVSMTMPEGLAGMISQVPLCGEAQANAGTCTAASEIGHVTVQAGVGGTPMTLPEAGKPVDPVYLTGPYAGAPFGLSIVVPAEAGPFDLGSVVVRAKIEVDPHTAQVSIVSNPMPQMLQGIPLDVKAIHVAIDRGGFMFNPTSCQPMTVTGAIGSAEGASSVVSTRFQAANCASLPFHPKFSTAIRAHHTRRGGEYMHVVITSGFGQASLRKVHVTLPRALPSRNSTLKQACTEAQFAKDPAGCPAGSFVGRASVHTPVLAKPLEGPAIFVSHGGAAFPDLDLVLKGEGVTIINVGKTNIHKGITSTTFGAIPDVPVNRIDLVLPTGPHSALAAFGNLCYRTVVKRKRIVVHRHGHLVHRVVKVRHTVRRRLFMPTSITGQNGAQITQKTKIGVQGCGSKAKSHSAHRKHRRHHHGRRT